MAVFPMIIVSLIQSLKQFIAACPRLHRGLFTSGSFRAATFPSMTPQSTVILSGSEGSPDLNRGFYNTFIMNLNY